MFSTSRSFLAPNCLAAIDVLPCCSRYYKSTAWRSKVPDPCCPSTGYSISPTAVTCSSARTAFSRRAAMIAGSPSLRTSCRTAMSAGRERPGRQTRLVEDHARAWTTLPFQKILLAKVHNHVKECRVCQCLGRVEDIVVYSRSSYANQKGHCFGELTKWAQLVLM